MSFRDTLFNTAIIDEQVNITPIDSNKNIDEIIIEKLKEKLEGYCTQYGYIEEVIKITKKEEHPKLNDNGSGDYIIKVQIEVMRCLPVKEQEIECQITADDEHMGVYVSFEEPIFISIITEEDLKVGDVVKVKVEDFQLKHRDSIITILTSYVDENKLEMTETESESEET